MIIRQVHVDDIQVGARHRALSQDNIDRIASSMAALGLMQPISVRLVDEMEVNGEALAGAPVLVAGHHRLEAARKLQWSHIDCVVVDDDDVRAEMCEIVENLHRLDLTKEQRDEHIRRYAELIEARPKIQVPQNAAPEIGYRKPPPQVKGPARQIAEETGLSVDTVRRALNPKPVEIKSAVDPETEEQATIREANAIVSAWNRARQAARDIALTQIDEPVFERTRSGAYA